MWSFLSSVLFWEFFINLLGLAVGIGGVGIAIRSNSRLRTANEAVAAARTRLLRQTSAVEFATIARTAFEFGLLIRARDWVAASRLGGEMRIATGRLRAWSFLLRNAEPDQLHRVDLEIDHLLVSIPAENADIPDDALREMTTGCALVMNSMSGIAGRLWVTGLTELEDA